ncbi:MAG: CPBP family intramembrane metalloprotease [Gemmatimonadales bacterium]|nr:CPBP family intramembrane metalloprotease [Gemmatimonadales bacterium]
MPKDYLAKSRAPRYSVLFALPLLLLYEGLSALLTGSAVEGVRNGADVLLKSLFLALGGRDGLAIFGVALLLAGGLLVWRDRRRAAEPLEPGIFGLMLAESAVYATLFGFVVGGLTTVVLRGPRGLSAGGLESLGLSTQLVVSLGAGIYEELVFRVLLVGALLWGMRVVLGTGKALSTAGAVIVSALVFSAFHYVGELGDTFTVPSFTFRALAGLVFSLLYVTRGFGIAAWTHALYDLGLSLILQVSGGSGR